MKVLKKLFFISLVSLMVTSCNAQSVEVTKLAFKEQTLSVKLNETKDIGLIVTPSNATNYAFQNYTPSVIRFDEGNKKVTGIKLGEGTLKVYNYPSETIKALLKVKVSQDAQGGDYTGAYYDSISKTATGSALTTALNALNNAKHTKTIYYSSLKNYYTQTDPGDRSGEVRSFYSGKSATFSGNMNKEHVWPNSKGGSLVEDDLHMVRPTLTSENSARGNEFYVENGKGDLGTGWDPANCGNASYRGDAARIIFYCCIANTQLTLVDKISDNKANLTMGKLSDLLRWNLEYPVQAREETRNNAVEGIQGNRNPFIDHPEYACKIWGEYSSTTRAICGM